MTVGDRVRVTVADETLDGTVQMASPDGAPLLIELDEPLIMSAPGGGVITTVLPIMPGGEGEEDGQWMEAITDRQVLIRPVPEGEA